MSVVIVMCEYGCSCCWLVHLVPVHGFAADYDYAPWPTKFSFEWGNFFFCNSAISRSNVIGKSCFCAAINWLVLDSNLNNYLSSPYISFLSPFVPTLFMFCPQQKKKLCFVFNIYRLVQVYYRWPTPP